MQLLTLCVLLSAAFIAAIAFTDNGLELRTVSLASAFGEQPVYGLSGSVEQDSELFKAYETRFVKNYASPGEYAQRFVNFRANLRKIDQSNRDQIAAGGLPVYGITKFSDWSEKELSRLRMTKESSKILAKHHDSLRMETSSSHTNKGYTSEEFPSSVDWRDKGAVGPVRNQGQCGSCWAFSAVQTVESFWYLAGRGPLNPLSVQQLVSCDSDDENCRGGFPLSGYRYISKVGGLASERKYPYTSGNGEVPSCRFNNSMVEAKISGYSWAATNGDEKNLMDAIVNEGPLSICIDAHNWAQYKSGVIVSCGTWIDHCVQLVGYANYTATPSAVSSGNSTGYYIVRNSWDTDWGQDGYIYVAMGKNMCAIADRATFVRI